MKVLILSRKPELPSIRRLIEEFNLAGHQTEVWDPESTGHPEMSPDLALPRFGTWHFEQALSILESFERARIPVVNRTTALRDARHKWISHLLLREEDIPTPSTQICRRSELPKTFPYIVKVPEGSKGDGVFLLRGPQDLLALPLLPEWIAQEFISEARGQDHRLIMSKREGLIAAMVRTAAPGDFRSNLARGGTAKAYTPTDLEVHWAQKALEAHNLDIGGVDILMSRSGPLILEVNGCPGLEGIEKASGENVASAYVRAAEQIARP